MEPSPGIDPRAFVSAVKPLLETRDTRGLLELLKSRWTKEQIVALLVGDDCDTRKVAALALSLVGCRECLPDLASKLRDPDPIVNQMAEHAMWSIWFRLGSPQANCEVHHGVEAVTRKQWKSAIEHFSRAIEMCPDFAEAWSQRATAHYLQEKFEQSADDAREAVARNPDHFGAWAAIGHSCAHLGRFCDALKAYERALAINPHMECVAEAIETIRSRHFPQE